MLFGLNAFRRASHFYERTLQLWAENAPARAPAALRPHARRRGPTSAARPSSSGPWARCSGRGQPRGCGRGATRTSTEALHMQGRRDAACTTTASERSSSCLRCAIVGGQGAGSHGVLAPPRVLDELNGGHSPPRRTRTRWPWGWGWRGCAATGDVQPRARKDTTVGLRRSPAPRRPSSEASSWRARWARRRRHAPANNLGSATFFPAAT